jgi:hypothetical protein
VKYKDANSPGLGAGFGFGFGRGLAFTGALTGFLAATFAFRTSSACNIFQDGRCALLTATHKFFPDIRSGHRRSERVEEKNEGKQDGERDLHGD